MGLGIPPLKISIMLESNPLKSIRLVRKLAVRPVRFGEGTRQEGVQRDDNELPGVKFGKVRPSGHRSFEFQTLVFAEAGRCK